jgi:predicted nucleotidyltransferase
MEILKNYTKIKNYGSMDLFNDLILYSIISKSNKEIRNFPLVNEGIENLLKKNVHSSRSVFDFVQSCINKRYPATRIQRLLIHMLLGADKDIYSRFKRPGYVRILACADKYLLSQISQKSKLPIFTSLKKSYNVSDLNVKTLIEFENKACDIYNMVCLKDKSDYCSEFSIKTKI